MSALLPPHEPLRRAAAWVSAMRKEKEDARPGASNAPAVLRALVDEACMRFDLSPNDSALLIDLFFNKATASQPES